eukprot:5544830-Amphidinium_carterae.1
MTPKIACTALLETDGSPAFSAPTRSQGERYGRFDPAMTDQLADMIAMKVQSRLGMGMPPMGT